MSKYTEHKQLNLSNINKDILSYWKENSTFEKSISTREGKPSFVFYEGPPSANGLPGIHHVLSRTIKDIFCRYQTQKGFKVFRKAGWDTHGLPVELGVEKKLGITKEDIGKTISVEDYNKACKENVMQFTAQWNELTEQMGYWVDLNNPYITYNNKYIESVWWLLAQLYKKQKLYKGYSIQPYSPAAGTGLSSHELNQPGCYKNVKDNTAVVLFKLKEVPQNATFTEASILAWTTTPWTLPSNTALAVGKNIDYVAVSTLHPFDKEKTVVVILAQNLLSKWFKTEADYTILANYKGSELEGLRYEQLLPYAKPEEGDAFKVLCGDFVTTEDGTGIVHIAPSFGADDFKVAKINGVGALTLVDKRGRFLNCVEDFANEYVKEAYLTDEEKASEIQRLQNLPETNELNKLIKQIVNRTNEYLTVDERIILKLQLEGKLFKKEKYEHSYPHCWRTDKPVLYYPLDSWFIKTTDYKERMVELNKTINWKPESTGTGRFGSWLENLQDWNLSRSRYWGIPLPIWTSEDKEEQLIIESAEELKNEIDKAIEAGFMTTNPLANFEPNNNTEDNYNTFDFHKPFVDEIILTKNGKKLVREADLIDVWFDSGAMPYAQLHYPFENKDLIDNSVNFPADFIAEGVDQTRGWFFTLHAISTMLFDKIAYKNVVSNGLVLDKNGVKMSKRLGNVIEPVNALNTYGADTIRWYMIGNASPWDNLKFDMEGVEEVKRKFFGTLHNTYSFFALYANVDAYVCKNIVNTPSSNVLDNWIISKLNTLINDVDAAYTDYEPTKAVRFITDFVTEQLSNWYVRLCRRRFWKGELNADKEVAYNTLYTCLLTISKLMAPVAPFFAERLFLDLNPFSEKDSVHLSEFPISNSALINSELEAEMELAQNVSSMILALRKKENIRVRQPLSKILVPVLSSTFENRLKNVESLILQETNIKEIEYLHDHTRIQKKIKPNFKVLGKKCGNLMKELGNAINELDAKKIAEIEQAGTLVISLTEQDYTLVLEDVEISSSDIPGMLINTEKGVTVALDITITPELKQEGIAREFVNRIQNIRKEMGLEITDRISITVQEQEFVKTALEQNKIYICNEVLANSLTYKPEVVGVGLELEEGIETMVEVVK